MFFFIRNFFYEFICFLHNSIIIVFVLLVYGDINITFFGFFIIFFFLFIITLFQITIITGIFGTRYSDFKELLNSILTILFFTSPIIWVKDFDSSIVDLNLVYHLIEIVRLPLQNSFPPINSVYYISVVNLILFFINSYTYTKSRNKIILWL